MQVRYNKDGVVTTITLVDRLSIAENGTKFLLHRRNYDTYVLIPSNKLLEIGFNSTKLTVLYNKDDEITEISNIELIIPTENGINFWIKPLSGSTKDNKFIPSNKLLLITDY